MEGTLNSQLRGDEKYQSLGVPRDHRSYPTHVTEGETGIERGNVVPRVLGQVSGRTRLKSWPLGSLTSRRVDTWVPGWPGFSAPKSVESEGLQSSVAQGTFSRMLPTRNMGPAHSDPLGLTWPGQSHPFQRFPRKGHPSTCHVSQVTCFSTSHTGCCKVLSLSTLGPSQQSHLFERISMYKTLRTMPATL